MVQLEGFCIACCVESTEAPGADELFGEEDGKAEDFVEGGGDAGEGISGCFGESAKELLIDLRRGHQRCEDDTTESLELRHSVSSGTGWVGGEERRDSEHDGEEGALA